MRDFVRRFLVRIAQVGLLVTLSVAPTAAVERLCDTAFENCRTPLLTLIQNEQAGIDVAFWFMQDARYANALIARFRAGVPVRVLVDVSANSSYANNATIVAMLRDAGIPIRTRNQPGILHWKTMIFAGQHQVQFSGANYSSDAFVPIDPYRNYVDEAIVFTDDTAVVNSFKTQYDTNWISDARFRDYANVARPLTRRYPVFPRAAELNFVPEENFATRSVARYQAERTGIDAIIYRITDKRHGNEMIAAVARGVTVRLITEPLQYRSTGYYWHAWNVDRMHMAGVQVRHRKHAGMTHQKTTLLYSQGMTIVGSSNWTSASATDQIEHNYFTTKVPFFLWFRDMFERKWFNETGNPETEPFVPLPPAVPSLVAPADAAVSQPLTGLKLQWKPGYWAHKADIYFGTTSSPPLLVRDVAVTPTTTASYTLPALQPGKTYYWRIVSKTVANKTATGALRRFTT